MAVFKDPNPPWPVPCRKFDPETDSVETRWAHNEKELDKFTRPENEGGLGMTTSQIRGVGWPKTMSHPNKDKPNVTVKNEKEQVKYEAQGYNFEHWDNAQAKLASAEQAAAPPSFDPKAQARIHELEKKLDYALGLLEQGQPKPARKRPGRKPKVEEPAIA